MDKKDKALARPSPIEAGQFRLTGYGHRIIRVEKKGKKGYCDLPTFLCPNRVDLEPTPLEVIDSPNGIIVVGDDFTVQLINPALCALLKVSAKQTVGQSVETVLDPSYFALCLAGENIRNKHVHLEKYDLYVELSLVHDERYHIIIGLVCATRLTGC